MVITSTLYFFWGRARMPLKFLPLLRKIRTRMYRNFVNHVKTVAPPPPSAPIRVMGMDGPGHVHAAALQRSEMPLPDQGSGPPTIGHLIASRNIGFPLPGPRRGRFRPPSRHCRSWCVAFFHPSPGRLRSCHLIYWTAAFEPDNRSVWDFVSWWDIINSPLV